MIFDVEDESQRELSLRQWFMLKANAGVSNGLAYVIATGLFFLVFQLYGWSQAGGPSDRAILDVGLIKAMVIGMSAFVLGRLLCWALFRQFTVSLLSSKEGQSLASAHHRCAITGYDNSPNRLWLSRLVGLGGFSCRHSESLVVYRLSVHYEHGFGVISLYMDE